MGDMRTFNIAGDYIAEQHVETQNVYLSANDNSIADQIKQRNNLKQEVIDVDYEPLDEYCEYIDKQAMAQYNLYTPMEFETMLRKACEQDAPSLVAFLKRYQKSGLLDFHGHKKKKIFETLRSHFPTMRNYTYTNFANYF